MSSAPNARCPRCGGGFHCGAADPMPCACSGLTLPPYTTRLLRERYAGCLCLRCLTELADDPPRTDEKKPAKP